MSTYNNLYSIHPRILRNRIYVKEYLKRPVVLWCGILYLAFLAINFVVGIFSSFATLATMNEWYAAMESITSFLPYGTSFEVSVSFPSISIIGIVTGIAFWILYFKSRNPKPDVAPTGGATTLWVLAIISLVGSCISAAVLILSGLLLIVCALIFFAADSGFFLGAESFDTFVTGIGVKALSSTIYDDIFNALGIASIILAAVSLVTAGILLFVSISELRFTSSIRKSLNSPVLYRKGAVAYGFIYIVKGLFSILTFGLTALLIPLCLFFDFGALLNVDVSLSALALPLAASLIPIAIQTVLYFCLSKFAYGYNKHIKAAGVNGENLPMPIIESPDRPRDFATASPTAAPYANAPSADNAQPVAIEEENPFAPPAPVYTEPHAEQTVDIPATETADIEPECDIIEEPYIEPEAPATNSVSIQDVNPEAKEIVNEVLASVSNNTTEKRTCDSCGASINATSKFCPRCGTSQF